VACPISNARRMPSASTGPVARRNAFSCSLKIGSPGARYSPSAPYT